MVNKAMIFWTHQNVPRPQNPFFGTGIWKIWKPGSNFLILWKYIKFAHGNSVHNGSYAFPNELMRFRNKAKPIWDKIRKHCKNAVIIQMWLWLFKSKTIKYGSFWKWCLRKYAVVGCKYMETFGCMSMPFGCMSMPFGCMSMDRLGACMRLLGAKSAATFGCMPDSR